LTSGYVRDRIGESHETKNGIITNKKISYCLRIPRTKDICNLMNTTYDDKQFYKFFRYNDFLLTRIKNIKKEEYNGTLYDLQMKEEHNYMLHNGIVHNGGGKRNGSFAIYLEPWHADVEDFLEMKKNHGDEESKARDLFYALWISDLFMERVKNNSKWSLFCPHECPGLADTYGDNFKELYEKYETQGNARKNVNARDLWFKILDAQMETGTPYILYKDSANKKSNQQNLGTIKSSNLCVAPETFILTDKGHVEIQTLVDQNVNVWNGEEWSSVTVKKTGTDQELIDVYTDDGLKLTCTPYHKFYIQNSYSTNAIEKIEAKDLKPNDKLIKCDYPIIDGNDTMPYAYTHGFFCGDGTYGNKTCEPERSCNFKALKNHYFCKRHIAYETEMYLFDKELELEDGEEMECQAKSYVKKPIAYLYGDKKKLLDFIDKRSFTVNDKSNRINVLLPVDLNEKFDVPSYNCSIQCKLDWFAGYCDADGTISRNGDNEQLQVSSINKEFLENIKLLLQTCGINPKLKLSQNRTESYLPDGNGGYKYYDVKPIYRLLITSYDLYNLHNLGFKPKRLIVCGNKPARDAKQFIKILKIENNNRIDDTYCFTEPKRNKGIFNGIITGQCTEIIEYSDDKETAVCNLASIGLPTFVNSETKSFDYDKLHYVTKIVTNNLNKVIDINYYPTEKTRTSNFKHRPIGIGVQGLADAFILMDIPFHSEKALEINKLIFETIYHAAVEKSNELAIERKHMIFNIIENKLLTRFDLLDVSNEFDIKPTSLRDENIQLCGSYSSFIGSPASKGILQFDMWNVTPSDRYDWNTLKKSIVENGMRNSLLVAPMPTASTSQILGYNECFEPLTSNIYTRRTLAGEFIIVNKYLMKELIDLNLWNEDIKNNIIANKGSIQQLIHLPQHIRDKYKIVWEMPMKHIIDMSADRGAFICQSQSLNLWVEDPTYNTLTSMHFYSWKKGLKTGIYYLRRKAKHQPQQFTIEPEKNTNNAEHNTSNNIEDEICEMCSA
jgi:ribonucleoside-diphosphate reductase alpha chain